MLWFTDNTDWNYVFSKGHVGGGLQAHSFPPFLDEIRKNIEYATGQKFNACLINKYNTGNDSLTYHSDDDPWLGSSFIVPSLSFGEERIFRVRTKEDHKLKEDYVTLNGSLMIMENGYQDNCQHSIVAEKNVKGIRYNLTFRNIIPNLVNKMPKGSKKTKEEAMMALGESSSVQSTEDNGDGSKLVIKNGVIRERWGDDAVAFTGSGDDYEQYSWFSNFFPVEFLSSETLKNMDNGEKKNYWWKSTEEYYHAMKAETFNDREYFDKIRNSKTPAQSKSLGKKVRNFDPKIWYEDGEAENIMYNAQYWKYSFKDNKKLLDYLLSTGDRLIIESSPWDKIWGTGLAITDKNALNPDKFKGTNLLGEILGEFRNDYRKIKQDILKKLPRVNQVIENKLYTGANPIYNDIDNSVEQLKALKSLGVNVIVNLQENEELSDNYEELMNKHKFKVIHVPIRDRGVGDDDVIKKLVREIYDLIENKNKIVFIHCLGGKGRSGTIVALLLHKFYGYDSDKALSETNRLFNTRVDKGKKALKSPQTKKQFDQVRRLIDEGLGDDGITVGRLQTGDAKGSDAEFTNIARQKGHDVIVYTAKDATNEHDTIMKKVAKKLKRSFPGRNEYTTNLLRRNLLQVMNSEAMFAVGFIDNDDNIDGGTAWTVELFKTINPGNPIYFFDQNTNKWLTYNYEDDTWMILDVVDELSVSGYTVYTGIGTRDLSDIGKEAIRGLYS